MSKRVQKKDTRLFFDSLKHFKNNLTNLIFFEMRTLFECKDAYEYLHLKKVNYKSKFPDMKKFGLIYYSTPADNHYDFTDIGFEIFTIIHSISINYKHKNYGEGRLPSIKAVDFFKLLEKDKSQIVTSNIIKLLLSYYDTADFLRPYLLLLKTIESLEITKLDDDILLDILAQKKQDILLGKFRSGSFDNLPSSLREEIIRPKSYIINALETAQVIDENRNIICDFIEIEAINQGLLLQHRLKEEIEDYTSKAGRPQKDQDQFRKEVIEAYNYKCAITNQSIKIKTLDGGTTYLLEAAHIVPYSEGGSFSVTNGIALSYEMHKLFDRKLFTFEYDEDFELVVKISKSKRIKDDNILIHLDNKKVNLPNSIKLYPDIDALEYRKNRHLLL